MAQHGDSTARFLFAGAPSDCDEQRLGDALRTAVEERLQDWLRPSWGVAFYGDFLKFCFKSVTPTM